MVKGRAAIKIIRPINLGVIILTQVCLYSFILNPVYELSDSTTRLSVSLIIQLIACTVLLAAGSYIINDIKDVKIDLINKPDQLIVGKHLTVRFSYWYYFSTIIIGLVLAVNIGIQADKLHLIWIYPMSITFLYYYADRWKKSFLMGNIIVAIFSAFVAGIILLAEWDGIYSLSNKRETTLSLFIFYIGFAFLTSLIREVVKDIQDMNGDRTAMARTIPIVKGISKTKIIIQVLNTILLLALSFWIYHYYEIIPLWKHILLTVFVIIPLVFTSILLHQAKEQNDYQQISQYLKLIMILGIVYLFVF